MRLVTIKLRQKMIKKIMKVMIDNNYKLLEEFDGYTGGRVLQGPRGNGFSKGFIFELTT